jgi:UDP-glucose 4-epimerase
MNRARIFVTGGSGFIGRNTITLLLQQGHSVVALKRSHEIVPALHPALRVFTGTIDRPAGEWLDAACGCDVLLHLAGDTTPASSASDPALDVRANLLPVLSLLEALRGKQIKRVVTLSSGGTIYGVPQTTPTDEGHPTVPTSPYGIVKLATEHMIRLWAVQQRAEHVILRVANPYGPHQHGRGDQGVIGTWLSRILADQPVSVWGDGSVVRDYIYVGDVAEALTLACDLPRIPSGAYNISTGTGLSLLQIAAAIAEATGLKPKLHFEPGRPYDVPVSILNPGRFEAATGWRAKTTLSKGIAHTYAFLKR